mgnify:CR=1 FL=1
MRVFYHGTTDALRIRKILLPPVITNCKREDWRKKYEDKVFFTTSLGTAHKFAKKACEKFGGNPIIYIVTIEGEFVADRAVVIGTAA